MGQYYRQGAGGMAKGREWGTGGAATIAPIVIALMKFHAIYAIRCRRSRRRRRRRRRWSRCWSSSLKEFCANFLRQSHDKALQQQQRTRVPLAKADRSEVEGGRATRREERCDGVLFVGPLMHVFPVYYYQHFFPPPPLFTLAHFVFSVNSLLTPLNLSPL